MLTAREAFKVGFISRCVEKGIPIEEIPGVVKQAMEKVAGVGDLIRGVTDIAKPVVSTAMGYGVPLALAAPPVLGGLAGYTAAQVSDIDDTDVEEIKKKEIIDELRKRRSQLLRDKRMRDYRSRRKATGRVFL